MPEKADGVDGLSKVTLIRELRKERARETASISQRCQTGS